ncbi:MAG TPA: dephospho-CoA kinase [Geobacteraceae bacterium]|nr:dephospho-CoA kinase [Geobacteraceae bacterium]
MRVIGLTGGIASGKSTVARLLAAHGIPVIDADQLARDAVLPGTPAFAAIVGLFGEGVLQADGTLDRQALGGRVFADPSLRRRLEAITHPAIRVLAEQKLGELRSRGEAVAVYMAPLLIEAGVTDRVDEIWVVYVDRETQLARVMARDGLSRDEAGQRLAAQMPMEEKAALGRIVIDNRGSEAELEKVVRALCRKELGRV